MDKKPEKRPSTMTSEGTVRRPPKYTTYGYALMKARNGFHMNKEDLSVLGIR